MTAPTPDPTTASAPTSARSGDGDIRERLEDWLIDNNWSDAYDLSHALMSSGFITPSVDGANVTGQPSSHARKGGRLQHVVVHVLVGLENPPMQFDDVLIFGQELDALRHIIGKSDWLYVAVAHGQSVAEALKVARS